MSNRMDGSISVISFRDRRPVAKWWIPGGGSPDMGGLSADGKRAVAVRALQRRGLCDLDRDRAPAARDPGGRRAARAVRVAAARALLDRSHGHPALAARALRPPTRASPRGRPTPRTARRTRVPRALRRTRVRIATAEQASYGLQQADIAGRHLIVATLPCSASISTVQGPMPGIARSRRQPRSWRGSSRSTRPLATSRAARSIVIARDPARSKDCSNAGAVPASASGVGRSPRRLSPPSQPVQRRPSRPTAGARSPPRARIRSAARRPPTRAPRTDRAAVPRAATVVCGSSARSSGSRCESVSGRASGPHRPPGAKRIRGNAVKRRLPLAARAPSSTRSGAGLGRRTSTGSAP